MLQALVAALAVVAARQPPPALNQSTGIRANAEQSTRTHSRTSLAHSGSAYG